jgi:tRNA (Thr-GGU) A37 N-methylase
MEILLRPIGIVHTVATEDEIRGEKKELEGEVEIFPAYQAGLAGIEGYSHVFLICYFHKLRPDQVGPLQVKPERLVNRGFSLEELPSLGVFSIDSPYAAQSHRSHARSPAKQGGAASKGHRDRLF